MVVVGLAVGEAGEVAPRPRSRSTPAAAFVFLVFVGSIAAFTAYNWLLRNVAISTVATYAFVNPVIAVFLGWLILSEEITAFVVARHRGDRGGGGVRRPESGRRGRPPCHPLHSGRPGKGGGPNVK